MQQAVTRRPARASARTSSRGAADFSDITLTDLPQSALEPSDSTVAASSSTRPGGAKGVVHWIRHTQLGYTATEFVVLLLFVGFFLFYGLIPIFGGDQLGLVGADEPRYAQIAREMLAAHTATCDAVHASIVPSSLRGAALKASYQCLMGGTVTPILYGKPWLEKPALYYWRAMGYYRELGVYDWTARLASATGALALIILAFLHLKRFRPGGHLDAALIMVSAVAMFAFSRGASTDMQLAAPFCIGMLGWYAWYETGKKFWLFDLYFFGAAATLAKGPVAPFLALSIICLFLGLRREWSALRRTIWIPGIVLYLVMVLPWYIAVQRRNPTFLNEFFWKHNLERYTTNLYHHHQPFYYYLVVLILGMMPWTALSFRALIDGLSTSFAEWKVRFKPQRYVGHVRAGDAFPGVPGVVGAVSDHFLLVLRFQTSGIHSSFHSAAGDSYGRLPLSDSKAGHLELVVVYAWGADWSSYLRTDSLPAVHGVPAADSGGGDFDLGDRAGHRGGVDGDPGDASVRRPTAAVGHDDSAGHPAVFSAGQKRPTAGSQLLGTSAGAGDSAS